MLKNTAEIKQLVIILQKLTTENQAMMRIVQTLCSVSVHCVAGLSENQVKL